MTADAYATANITRCGQCGDWAFMHDLCPTCTAPVLTRYTPPTRGANR